MRENNIILGVTPNGKEIGARIRPNTTHWEVFFKEGGQLPKEFDSLFTSTAQAKLAVEQYLGRIAEKKGTAKADA